PRVSARRAQLLLRFEGAALELDADARLIMLDARLGEIAGHLVDDVLRAGLLEIGAEHVLRIMLRRVAGEAKLARRPEAEQLVAPRTDLEGEFLILLEFALEALSPLLEAAHRPSASDLLPIAPSQANVGARVAHVHDGCPHPTGP